MVEEKNRVENKEVNSESNYVSKVTVPIWKKYSLSIPEAAEYYGIGEKRLRQIAYMNTGANYLLEIGSHIRFKRRLFEEYLDMASVV